MSISLNMVFIPVITHESDLTPGLANRINMNFAQKICTTFPETLQHLPKDKGEFIGAIVRPELKEGDREARPVGIAFINLVSFNYG